MVTEKRKNSPESAVGAILYKTYRSILLSGVESKSNSKKIRNPILESALIYSKQNKKARTETERA